MLITPIPQEAPRPGGLAPNDSASSTEESVVQPGSQIPEIAAELEGELIKDMTVPPHPGGYSLVYKGTWRRLGLPDEKVAIKCLISTHMGGTVTEVEKRKRNDIVRIEVHCPIRQGADTPFPPSA